MSDDLEKLLDRFKVEVKDEIDEELDYIRASMRKMRHRQKEIRDSVEWLESRISDIQSQVEKEGRKIRRTIEEHSDRLEAAEDSES